MLMLDILHQSELTLGSRLNAIQEFFVLTTMCGKSTRKALNIRPFAGQERLCWRIKWFAWFSPNWCLAWKWKKSRMVNISIEFEKIMSFKGVSYEFCAWDEQHTRKDHRWNRQRSLFWYDGNSCATCKRLNGLWMR